MRHIATDFARSAACWSWTSYIKTAEPIEMSFGWLTHVGPRNHVLDGGPDRTNTFTAARGDKSAMRPFAKLLCILVYFHKEVA